MANAGAKGGRIDGGRAQSFRIAGKSDTQRLRQAGVIIIWRDDLIRQQNFMGRYALFFRFGDYFLKLGCAKAKGRQKGQIGGKLGAAG